MKSFRESLGKKKLQDRFYKGEDGLNLRGSFSHRDSVVTTRSKDSKTNTFVPKSKTMSKNSRLQTEQTMHERDAYNDLPLTMK